MEINLTNEVGASIGAHLDYKKADSCVKIITEMNLSPEYQEQMKNIGATVVAPDEFDFPVEYFGEPPMFDFNSFFMSDDTWYQKVKDEENRVKDLLSQIWQITVK